MVCTKFSASPLNKDTVSLTFYRLVHFTFDNVLWNFAYKNKGLAAFLNWGFGVGEDLHWFFAIFLLLAILAHCVAC